MNIVEIIEKKRQGQVLSSAEINYVIKSYTNNQIPDYQMAALAMAITICGMNKKETTALTMAMANSGEIMNLDAVPGIKLDKHSTGGVGDKTTLAVAPIVAALGGKIAKMSGRGLGFTGGTLDKLESIPGFKVTLSDQEFIDQVNKINLAVISQTKNVAPADKKLYALRDVTGTVQSLPLIVASIMSKKIATGANAILLDVKCGDGALMKNLTAATELAQ